MDRDYFKYWRRLAAQQHSYKVLRITDILDMGLG